MNFLLLAVAATASLLMLGLVIRRITLDARDTITRVSSYQDPAAAADVAAAISRLANPNDTYFLRLQPGYQRNLERKMRRSRRSVLNLFLRQHYADFRGLMAAAAELARHEESDFGADLVGLSLRFHCLYFIAWTESRLLGRVSRSQPHERIAGIVRGLRLNMIAQNRPGVEVHDL